MSYQLPNLPYATDALEPFIDKATMELHHGKHHATYVAKLNAAIENHLDLARLPVEELLRNVEKLPEAVRTAVVNHGGGHANHSLFWRILGPDAGGKPSGALLEALTTHFSSFDLFKEKLASAAVTLFGSGWAWLVLDKKRGLDIVTTPNQVSPLSAGQTPLLCIDVWEHAYYLKYQNRRQDYVAALWNVINWREVEKRFEEYR